MYIRRQPHTLHGNHILQCSTKCTIAYLHIFEMEPTFPTHHFNSSNSIEPNNLVNRGTADRASPLLRLYILQAGHATSHVSAWDAGAFHRGIQTYNTSTGGSLAAVACISFISLLFRRCCRYTCCCTTSGGSWHGYINRRGVYGWIVNRTIVEGFFNEWWRSWGWKSLKCATIR